jgi:hypothetical protein
VRPHLSFRICPRTASVRIVSLRRPDLIILEITALMNHVVPSAIAPQAPSQPEVPGPAPRMIPVKLRRQALRHGCAITLDLFPGYVSNLANRSRVGIRMERGPTPGKTKGRAISLMTSYASIRRVTARQG